MSKLRSFRVPTRPYTIVDAYNRSAAAKGSPKIGKTASNADYNGHNVSVCWNEFRRYYIAEYWWAGRNVLARGNLESCIQAALNEYNRGALGAGVSVIPKPEDVEICLKFPELQEGADDRLWYTWRHTVAGNCAPDYANPGAFKYHFDLDLLNAANSESEYYEMIRSKYGMR